MPSLTPSRKRKATTRDSAKSKEAALFDELGNGLLDAASDKSDEDSASGYDAFLSEDAISEEDGDERDEASTPELSDDEENVLGDFPAPRDIVNGVGRAGEVDEVAEESEDEEDPLSIVPRLTQDANGNVRYVYRDIDPVYDSDDSDAPATANTIGNIPLSFYDSYPHIGYDLDGKRVMRPAKGAALDSLLNSIEIPKGWTGLTDPSTGKPLQLNDEELDVLKRLTRNEVPVDGYDPYPDMVEYFTSRTEPMPLSAAPEPKRRFVPSKHEAVRVMKIVKAIREGRIAPYRPQVEHAEDEEEEMIKYDIWADETSQPKHQTSIPAPKLPPPGYDESYHPPPEYVPDEKDRKAWQDADEEDREKEYLPSDFGALRKVPGYGRFLKEKFERCLDLYLAPRVRRTKLNVDPDSLLPDLPIPEELRPYPERCCMVMSGHRGRVRSIEYHPGGKMLASGGDDGVVHIWDASNGRLIWRVKLSEESAVDVISWRPTKETFILAAATGEVVYLIAPNFPNYRIEDVDSTQVSRDLLNAGWASIETDTNGTSKGKEALAKWGRPSLNLQSAGVMVQVALRSSVKTISWHRRGDYFSTVSPRGQRSAIAIHTLSQHRTVLPISKLKGLPQYVQFHPFKPMFFVATQRSIRAYDLARQELSKILQPGARWISSFDIHPGGDNLIVGSFDKRVMWMDLDLSTRPYKTLRLHAKAVRSVKFHQGGYPLFADASDDGSVRIFHGKVVGDLMENATIVPLPALEGHRIEAGLGVLDIAWHPFEPYVASAGADGTCRIWSPGPV